MVSEVNGKEMKVNGSTRVTGRTRRRLNAHGCYSGGSFVLCDFVSYHW